MPGKVIKQIEPLDEEELEKDLRFIYHNRSETVDEFIDEIVPTIKYHLNEAMSRYQNSLIEDLSRQLKSDVVDIVVRSKRKTVVEKKDDEWRS